MYYNTTKNILCLEIQHSNLHILINRMIYLSAQPDDFYFKWQLEIQIYNFKKKGIPKEEIHVLLSYDPKLGLKEYFKSFVENNQDACFYIYPDNRENKEFH